jgi:tRNA (cmo5U34)-methyltransferase
MLPLKVSVKSVFDRVAAEYDRSRRQLIPCFDLYYETAVELVAGAVSGPARILDLGAGTGLLSAYVLDALPEARVTLVDISDQMMAEARARFEARGSQCDYALADYREGLPAGPFHAVVSGLSIHHLEETEKQRLFSRIFATLTPGGIFVNADQAQGETPLIDRRYREAWVQKIQAAGITGEQLTDARERTKVDRMSPLATQLAWLRAAGFEEVNCWFKHYNFVVFSGRKPKE